MAISTKDNPTSENLTKSSIIRNIIFIFPIIAVIAFIWLLMLYLDQLPESLTFNQDFKTWLNIWLVILILIIVILVCIPQSGEPTATTEVKVQQKTKKVSKSPKPSAGLMTSTMVPVEDDETPVEFVPLVEDEQKTETGKVTPTSISKDSTKIKPLPDKISPDYMKPEPKPIDTTITSISKGKVKPKIIEYPLEVEGGLYGDTFIELNDDTTLKLRTLVVKDIYLV